MANPCTPSSQKSDFFKISVICFVCIVVVHKWNLADIVTNTTVRKAPRSTNHLTFSYPPYGTDDDDDDDLQGYDEQDHIYRGGLGIAYKWTPATPIKITHRRFASSEKNQVFFLGAVAKNSTPDSGWDQVALYGQWHNHRGVNASTVKCCLMYGNGTVVQTDYEEFIVDNYKKGMLKARLMIFHITCPYPPDNPVRVSVVRYSSCANPYVRYLKPKFAMKKPDGHLVITTKMAYRYLDPEQVVGFLETSRLLGVNKVITYVMDNLEPSIKNILRYYAYIGILEYYTIELAEEKQVFRRFPPIVNAQYRCDEWIVKRDALERSIGSSYFGIFDMDEYLIPSRKRTYQKLMSDLLMSFPRASHFFFPNVHYLVDHTEQDPICAPNCSVFRRHTLTSPDRFNLIHEKMFLVTTRVISSTVTNHRISPKRGYARVTCPQKEAYIRHYGRCHRKFSKEICQNESLWIRDTSMVDWAESHVHDNIQKTLRFLGGFNNVSKK